MQPVHKQFSSFEWHENKQQADIHETWNRLSKSSGRIERTASGKKFRSTWRSSHMGNLSRFAHDNRDRLCAALNPAGLSRAARQNEQERIVRYSAEEIKK